MSEHWNLRKIRPSNGETPPGRPDVLFFVPEESNTTHYKNFFFFFFFIIIIYNHTEEHYIQFYTYINYIKDPSYVNCVTILVININIPLTLFCLHCL